MIRKIATTIIDAPINSTSTRQTSTIFAKTTTKNQFSTLSSDDPTGIYQPNQTTKIFTRMEQQCPEVLKEYAQCVIEKQNNGVLVKGACEDSFERVMDCFRRVRRWEVDVIHWLNDDWIRWWFGLVFSSMARVVVVVGACDLKSIGRMQNCVTFLRNNNG